MFRDPGVVSSSLVTDSCSLSAPEEIQALIEQDNAVPYSIAAVGNGSSEVSQDSSYLTLCQGKVVLKMDTSPEAYLGMLNRQAALFNTSYPYLS